MTARTIATVFVCLAVVFAGCGGVLDSAKERAKDAAEDAAGDALNESVDDVLNESRIDDLANAANMTLVGFGFDQPAKYTYEIAVAQGDLQRTGSQPIRGRLTVDVREVAAGNVTLGIRYELDGETYEATVSGTQGAVAAEFASVSEFTDVSPRMQALRSHTSLALTLGMSLYLSGYASSFVNIESLQTGDKPVSFETGTDTYAGVECKVTTVSTGGTPIAESCVSTELGLPVYVVLYDESGTPDTWITLVEYET